MLYLINYDSYCFVYSISYGYWWWRYAGSSIYVELIPGWAASAAGFMLVTIY